MTPVSRHDGLLKVDESLGDSGFVSAPRGLVPAWSDFKQLTKVRITGMVAGTAWLGHLMAVRDGEAGLLGGAGAATGTSLSLLGAMLGSALACMGSSCLNQACERDTDSRMHRTRQRPLPTARVSVPAAFLLGATLATTGIVVLAATTTALAAALAAFTVLSYVLIYTPLKRVSSTSVIVGAVPGALPPIIGYAAAAGDIGPGAWAMFAIMFLWQIPHFLAIAWMYREDYARAGFPMLPTLDPTGESTFRHMLLTTMALLPLGLLPTVLGLCGPVYFVTALLAGAGFLAFAAALLIRKTTGHARAVFFASLVYLPVILAVMVIDRV